MFDPSRKVRRRLHRDAERAESSQVNGGVTVRGAVFVFLFLAFAAPVSAAELPAQLAVRIEEIYQQRLYDPAQPGVRWSHDGASYMRQELSRDGSLQVVRCKPDHEPCELVLSLRELKTKMQAIEPALRTMNGYVLSRDGRWVVAGGDFTGTSNGINALDLFLYERRGGLVRKVARSVTLADPATLFSPDGRWVLFGRDQNLFVYDTKTDKTRQLTFDGAFGSIGNGTADDKGTFVVWSPDSSRVAFM